MSSAGVVYLCLDSQYDKLPGRARIVDGRSIDSTFDERQDMSDAKVRGIVHFIDETRTYGQKGFRKRLVVLEQENDRFTNYIPVEFIRDSCDSVDELSVGDDVEVSYRLSGRKWQKDPSAEVKYFLNAEATSFKKLDGGQTDTTSTASAKSSGDASDANSELAEAAFDENDIPF